MIKRLLILRDEKLCARKMQKTHVISFLRIVLATVFAGKFENVGMALSGGERIKENMGQNGLSDFCFIGCLRKDVGCVENKVFEYMEE